MLLSSARGCRGKQTSGDLSEDGIHILTSARLSAEYKEEHNGKLPSTRNELSSWAKTQKATLERLPVTDVDTAFVSPRDRQHYVLHKPANTPMSMVVYEKIGANGKFLTATNMGNVAELDEKELKESLGRAQ